MFLIDFEYLKFKLFKKIYIKVILMDIFKVKFIQI